MGIVLCQFYIRRRTVPCPIIDSPNYDSTVFTRTKNSYIKEWRAHNGFDFVIPWDISEHTGDVDLNIDDPFRVLYELWVF